jgi:hypothetical protein
MGAEGGKEIGAALKTNATLQHWTCIIATSWVTKPAK